MARPGSNTRGKSRVGDPLNVKPTQITMDIPRRFASLKSIEFRTASGSGSIHPMLMPAEPSTYAVDLFIESYTLIRR
jgi:hypothetical protein